MRGLRAPPRAPREEVAACLGTWRGEGVEAASKRLYNYGYDGVEMLNNL